LLRVGWRSDMKSRSCVLPLQYQIDDVTVHKERIMSLALLFPKEPSVQNDSDEVVMIPTSPSASDRTKHTAIERQLPIADRNCPRNTVAHQRRLFIHSQKSNSFMGHHHDANSISIRIPPSRRCPIVNQTTSPFHAYASNSKQLRRHIHELE